MSETVTGYIDHVIFRNEDNGYTVMVLKGLEEEKELTCVGTFPAITQGAAIEASGNYTTHPVYGKQFQISSYVEKMPEDALAMERYLGSGAIKGIGAALAARIVRRFGDDTMRIVEEEPERLAEIKGISEKKAMEIAEQMTEKADMRRAMIFLQKYGISLNLGAKIYQKYGQTVYGVLQENPYRLAEDISGVGFRTADEIAKRIGIHTDSDYRIRSGIFYTLLQGVNAGHIFLDEELLARRAGQLLEVDLEHIEKYLMDLSMERKVILKEADGVKRVYPSNYYYMEMNTAKMLHDLNVTYDVSETGVLHRLAQIEENMDLPLDEKQREAVVEAVRHGVLVLTGGPGTGKTTTINAMIHYFESDGADILLAAPTGRAAKRMTETTGYEAQTVHRLLEVSGNPEDEEQKNGFSRNRDNPLETDVIIVDEMSMVDLPLMHALLSAVCVGTRLILVGDRNQLPSVGPGSVLKDIIASKCFPVVKLTRIFRQAGESDIVVNAHKINRGEPVILDNKSRDFFFLKRQDANTIISVVLTLIQKKLPKYVNAEPYDIQVLTPMRKGLLGVERLNGILQEYLNPPSPSKAEKEYGDKKFREGDKVMQIRNNYQIEWEVCTKYGMTVDKGLGVFNGDMGIIREINTYAETMTVEFDEHRQVSYSFQSLDELELAYAITIHKSQGSEYPAVVIPLLQGPRQLYNRNLIYTAVTRARKCVTLVGSEQVFADMIRNNNELNRNSSLAEQIREFCL